MIKIQTNGIAEITATLSQLASKAKHRKPLMRDIAAIMEKAVLTNFNEGGRPTWLGIKHRQGTPLIDSGILKSSITSEYDNNSAVVGTNEGYAAIHQFGGMAGRGRKVEIPARPFLVLTLQDEEDILQGIQDYFQQVLE